MAIGQSVPLVLRGPEKVGSWAPARLPGPDDDLMERLVALYDGDAFLGPRLEAALNADRLAGGSPGGRGRPGEQFGKLAQAAARMLADTAGPRIAVLEAGGWDSHANQGREGGALARRLHCVPLASVPTCFAQPLLRNRCTTTPPDPPPAGSP